MPRKRRRFDQLRRYIRGVRSLLADLIGAAVLTALELAGLVWLIGKLCGR